MSVARIYKPSPSATQSGKGATTFWVLVHGPTTAMQVEPLMGWTSSGDMNRQVTLRFGSKEEAVAYAERNGIAYRVEAEKIIDRKVLSYSDNFKSTRRGMWTH